ncbi:TIGR03663 family protein [soil metagenome]
MALGGIVLVAAILRFVKLGDRPMHHDESLDAWFSWRVERGETIPYDPVYHGPLRFYLTAGTFRAFGEGEATARAVAALAGTATAALVGATRRWLGDVGSLAAAAMVAVSPSMLYFGRFGREDSLMALLELALMVVTMAWLHRPARWQPPVALAVLALAFATKESTFIVGAVMGSYVVLLAVADEVRARRRGRIGPTVLGSLREAGWRSWVVALMGFTFVFSLVFSAGFTHLAGIGDGAFEGIRYWLSQQPVNRGSMPWPFYLLLLAGYEWPIVVLGLLGLGAAWRTRDRILGLVAWTALGNLVIYSWASERFPWLVIHPLLPMIVLAGFGADRLWARRRSDAPWGATPYLAGAGLVLVVLATNAVRVTYAEPNNPRQLLVAVQTGPAVPELRDRIDRIYAAAPAGVVPRVVVDSSASASWPWAWYLRDRPVAFVDLSADPEAAAGADVVLAIEPDDQALASPPEGWTATRFDHRVWWLPDWDHAGPADYLGWIANRRTFGPTGSLRAVMLTRVGLAGAD